MAKIPIEQLPSFIGKGVHVSWAKRGCIWILESIVEDKVMLRTPKTGKKIVAKASEICYTKRHLPYRSSHEEETKEK